MGWHSCLSNITANRFFEELAGAAVESYTFVWKFYLHNVNALTWLFFLFLSYLSYRVFFSCHEVSTCVVSFHQSCRIKSQDEKQLLSVPTLSTAAMNTNHVGRNINNKYNFNIIISLSDPIIHLHLKSELWSTISISIDYLIGISVFYSVELQGRDFRLEV